MRVRPLLILSVLMAAGLALGFLIRPSAPPRVEVVSKPRTIPLLQPGLSADRELANGGGHAYRVPLRAGHFLEAVVDQRGIDVSVTLLDPSGKPLLQVDTPSGSTGPETVLAVVATTGDHRLEVRSVGGTSSVAGHYRIRIKRFWRASERDRLRAQAAWLFADGERLRRARALPDSEARYEEALPIWRAVADPQGEVDTLYRLGRIYQDLGQVDRARRRFEVALPRYRALGDPESEADLWHRIGSLSTDERGIDAYRRAVTLYRSLHNLRSEAATLGRIAESESQLKHPYSALVAARQAVEVQRRLGDPPALAEALAFLGRLYASLGQLEEARDVFTEALRLNQTALEARLFIERGGVLRDLEAYKVAVADLERALRIQQGGSPGEVALTQAILGGILFKADRLSESRAVYQAARVALEGKDRHSEATVRVSLGRIADLEGHSQKALLLLNQALTLFREEGNLALREASTLFALAGAQERLGNLGEARRNIEEAIGIVEAERGSLAGSQASAFFASRQSYYELYRGVLVEMHRREPTGGFAALAFDAAEMSRGRSLHQALLESRAAVGKVADPALARRESELRRKLNDLEMRRLRSGAAGTERAVRAAIAELRALQAEIVLRGKRKAAPTPRTLRLEEVQRLLDPDTLLLSYSLGEKKSFLLLVGDRSITVHDLPARSEIESRARTLLDRMPDSNLRGHEKKTQLLADMLGQILLGPVAGEFGRKRLVIGAEGVLQLVPFAALTLEQEDRGPVPLMADHEIVYLPSASVLAEQRRKAADRRPAPKAVAVLGDPVFRGDDPRVRGGAGPARPLLLADGTRSARGQGPGELRRLPGTRKEAQAILSLVPPGESFVALDFAASRKTATWPDLKLHRMLHFATHGLLHAEYPELSGLVFSLVDEKGRPQDGFLRAHEIRSLDLPVDLVVLSACETALGPEIRGEGVMGLPRAFQEAGASRVVVSLWDVDDRATAELMRRFYESMSQGKLPAAAALRQAQLSMSRELAWHSPAYWAGFVLQGDWR